MPSRLTFLLALVVALVLPAKAQAAGYLVQPGDTLASIASRYHISIGALVHANGIRNANLVEAGRYLVIPQQVRHFRYHVQWGDSLLGLAARFHTTVSSIRSLNPSLGAYPLAGQWLVLCSGCGAQARYASAGSASTGVGGGTSSSSTGGSYVVRAGDNLTVIARRYGVSLSGLAAANGITNLDQVVIGTVLRIPSAYTATGFGGYAAVHYLVNRYAAYYGLNPTLPMAVAWEESGFNENEISPTGAIGVMQVEPYTAAHINRLLGLSLNMYNLDDNVHAGVYWLAVLMRYYGGNERYAIAAYYEGTRALARVGMYTDTVQYVNNVLALQQRLGG